MIDYKSAYDRIKAIVLEGDTGTTPPPVVVTPPPVVDRPPDAVEVGVLPWQNQIGIKTFFCKSGLRYVFPVTVPLGKNSQGKLGYFAQVPADDQAYNQRAVGV